MKRSLLVVGLLIVLTGCGSSKVPADLINESYMLESYYDAPAYEYLIDTEMLEADFVYYDATIPEESGMSLYVEYGDDYQEIAVTEIGEMSCDSSRLSSYGESLTECQPVFNTLESSAKELGYKDQLNAIVSVFEHESGIKI